MDLLLKMLGILWPVLLLLVIIAIVRAVMQRRPSSAQMPTSAAEVESDERPLSCEAVPLLSESECLFHRVLSKACQGKGIALLAKVRLLDIVKPAKGSPPGDRNRVDKKHVDFLLCRPSDFMPLCVVELDDNSHSRASAKKADATKDAALASAGVPIVRCRVAATYNVEELSSHLDRACQARNA